MFVAALDTIATIKQLEDNGLSLQAITTALNRAGDPDLTATLESLAAGRKALQATAENAPHAQALLTLISARARPHRPGTDDRRLTTPVTPGRFSQGSACGATGNA